MYEYDEDESKYTQDDVDKYEAAMKVICHYCEQGICQMCSNYDLLMKMKQYE